MSQPAPGGRPGKISTHELVDQAPGPAGALAVMADMISYHREACRCSLMLGASRCRYPVQCQNATRRRLRSAKQHQRLKQSGEVDSVRKNQLSLGMTQHPL